MKASELSASGKKHLKKLGLTQQRVYLVFDILLTPWQCLYSVARLLTRVFAV